MIGRGEKLQKKEIKKTKEFSTITRVNDQSPQHNQNKLLWGSASKLENWLKLEIV